MKRWLKAHGRWSTIGLGVLFIGNSIWGLIEADASWKIVLHACAIISWAAIILFVSGVLFKLFKWWEKD